MSPKKNILANYLGQIWAGLMGLLFVPTYIKLIGIEGYGLLGFMTSLQAVMILLDLGLSQSLNREVARLSALVDSERQLIDTARTLEVVYWFMGVVVLLLLLALSPPIATYWLFAEKLSPQEVVSALNMIAVLIAVRWPIAMYSGGLNGLQRQVDLNYVTLLIATLQGIGSVLVLKWISPTLYAFLIWQIIVGMLNVLLLYQLFWKCLPQRMVGKFRVTIIQDLGKFAAGIVIITLTSVLLMQVDKLLLSKLLSLKEFGYYTFAAVVAGVVGRVVAPISTAYYPKITALIATNDSKALIDSYHQGCQLLAAVVLPVAFVIAFFSTELLTIWTQDTALAEQSAWILSILVLGNALNGLMTLPYLLQLGYGHTRLTIRMNMVLVMFAIPSIYFAAVYWGALAVAGIWGLINLSYILIGIHLVHCDFLVTEKWYWYKNDLGKIIVPVMLVVATGKCVLFLASTSNVLIQLTVIAVTTAFAFLVAFYSAESFKNILVNKVKKIWVMAR